MPEGSLSVNLPGTSPADRDTLIRNGYEPIPIKGKFPTWQGWRSGEITPERLREVEAAFSDHTGTGLRTGALCAFDVDVRNGEHAAVALKAITATLGSTPLQRVGAKPGGPLRFRDQR